MPHQSVVPSFYKWGIPGLQFTLVPAGVQPSEFYFGYEFSQATTGWILSGAFSPHQIIRPGKDEISVKADVWWLGPAATSDVWVDMTGESNPFVGWIAYIEMVKADMGPLLIPSLTVENLTIVPHSVDSGGNISWYVLNTPLGGDVHVDHPYLQFAVGGESVVKPANEFVYSWTKETSADKLRYGDLSGTSPTLYRTTLYAIKKKGDSYVTELPTFRNFAAKLDETDVGVIIGLSRMYNCSLNDGTFDMDGDGVGDTDNLKDTDWGVEAPIFLGIEARIY